MQPAFASVSFLPARPDGPGGLRRSRLRRPDVLHGNVGQQHLHAGDSFAAFRRAVRGLAPRTVARRVDRVSGVRRRLSPALQRPLAADRPDHQPRPGLAEQESATNRDTRASCRGRRVRPSALDLREQRRVHHQHRHCSGMPRPAAASAPAIYPPFLRIGHALLSPLFGLIGAADCVLAVCRRQQECENDRRPHVLIHIPLQDPLDRPARGRLRRSSAPRYRRRPSPPAGRCPWRCPARAADHRDIVHVVARRHRFPHRRCPTRVPAVGCRTTCSRRRGRSRT